MFTVAYNPRLLVCGARSEATSRKIVSYVYIYINLYIYMQNVAFAVASLQPYLAAPSPSHCHEFLPRSSRVV